MIDALTKATQESADGDDLPDDKIADIAAAYETTINVPIVEDTKPWMLCAVGLVGAGKTPVIKSLSERFNLYRISTDEIRIILRAHGYNYLRTREIAAAVTQKAAAEGYSLAFDGDSIAPENRAILAKLTEKTSMRQIWIHINPPEKFILNKLQNTVHYGPDGLFKNADEAIANHFRRKPLHEQYLPEISFDFTFDTSQKNLKEQIDDFAKRMAALGI